MSEINDLYVLGNLSFTAGNYELAKQHYSAALMSSEVASSNLEVKLFLNRSMCSLKLRDYESVVEDCSQVLRRDPRNSKALLRRSSANEYLGDIQKAFQDISKVLEDPNTHRNLVEQAIRDFSRLKAAVQLDNTLLREAGRPECLVTREQVIRLMFVTPPPPNVLEGQEFIVKVCAGNEFGLWDRSHMDCVPSGSPVSIHSVCTLVQFQNFDSVQEGQAFLVEKVLSSDLHRDVFDHNGKLELVLKISRDSSIGTAAAAGGATTTSASSLSLSTSPPPRGSASGSGSGSGSASGSESGSGSALVLLKIDLSHSLPSGATVRSVLSLPVLLSRSGGGSSSSSNSSSSSSSSDVMSLQLLGHELSPSCIRDVWVRERQLLVLECPGTLGIGGKVWDSTFVLLSYLAEHAHLIAHKKVLELGSGTGLAGIGLSMLQPSRVVLTDVAEVVPLLSANILLNQHTVCDGVSRQLLATCYSAEEHFWGSEPSASLLEASEVLVASDVVYDPVGYQPLVTSLMRLLAHPRATEGEGKREGEREGKGEGEGGDHTEEHRNVATNKLCILAHRHRHPEDSRFFSMLASQDGLVVQQVAYELPASLSTSTDLRDVQIFHLYCK